MFRFLGNAVVRLWPLLLVAWIGVLIVARGSAPEWTNVVTDGEFEFLPDSSPSLRGERLFKKAFPDDVLSSSVVIVVRRVRKALLEQDKDFIENTLKPRLEKIANDAGGLAHRQNEPSDSEEDGSAGDSESSKQASGPEDRGDPSIISRVRTFNDDVIGPLLNSEDEKSSLVVVELTTEFLDARNAETIEKIENLIYRDERFRKSIPPGLDIKTSGAATVGRDMIQAGVESGDATEKWTLILVVVLLLLIYRAPFLVFIPLLTVGVATEITLGLLAHIAQAGYIDLFRDINVYVKVLSYGAGVDYCLFLIARYKEELDEGANTRQGLSNALAKVGAALTASAGTVMCGIGMMVFAEFGKFQQAGIGITLGLFVVLCAALTFTPSLLRLVGPLAFWPQVPTKRLAATAGWISSTSLLARFMELNLFQVGWSKVGQALLRRPGLFWTVSIAIMLPFVVVAIKYYTFLSYGLLTELPQDKPSVVGAKSVQTHFPAGITGPVTILLRNPEIDFSENADLLEDLTARLTNRKDSLKLADIRSVSRPLGIRVELSPIRLALIIRGSRDYYISAVDEMKGHVARLDLVFHDDPFSRDSIGELTRLLQAVDSALQGHMLGILFDEVDENKITDLVPESPAAESGLRTGDRITAIDGTAISSHSDIHQALSDAEDQRPLKLNIVRNLDNGESKSIQIDVLPNGSFKRIARTELLAIGPTASIRDLKEVTDRDQIRIDILVLVGVFLILVALLKRLAVSAYLIVSVFFSYLATLGVTFVVFYLLDPQGFSGLDWKVPMFLFTILIAVGEDYNIFLMTRIEEEQARHGKTEGVVVALRKTGSIISSCGIIMAGTFSSLMFGSLVGMQQLGFALAFGVLLDTFVVRPILVPAYLILLYQGKLGAVGKLLGAGATEPAVTPATVEVGVKS